MSGFKQMFKNKIWIIIALFLIIGTAIPVEAQGFLTQEEKDYIARGGTVIKAASIDGGAPLHYIDSKGE